MAAPGSGPTRTARVARAAIRAGALLALALTLPACGGGKSYHFPRVEIEARVLHDGTLELRERRTYEFNGEFSSAFFTVEPARNPFAVIEDFTVREHGEEIPVRLVPGGGVEASWSYSARDERRTFEISYRVRCALEVYDDAAHLLWQFVGTGWTETTDHLRVVVHLPGRAVDPPPRPDTPGCPEETAAPAAEPLDPGDTRAWGHGPLGGEVRIPDPQTVVLTADDLQPGQLVEASILMPEDAVPSLFPYPGGAGEARILAEEAAAAERANELRARYRRERTVTLWLLGGIPAFFLMLVLLSKLRDRVPGVPRYLEEPPEDLHPVELAYLWDAYRGRYLSRTAYRAQLLHLARQGAIELEAVGRVTEPEDVRIRLLKRPKTGVDREFADFLFPDHKTEVSLKEIGARGKRRKPFIAWTAAVKLKTGDNVDRVRKSGPRLESLLMWAAVIGAGIWSAVADLYARLPFWTAVIAFVSLIVAQRFMAPRLPQDLRVRLARWKAFRRFLKEFPSLEDASTLAVIIWERYLVYATALGVAERVEEQLQGLVRPEQLPSPWKGAPAGDSGLGLVHAFRVSAPALAPTPSLGTGSSSSSFSSGVGSFSSSGGGGGGFSGGGGGGGGGTGGGAG